MKRYATATWTGTGKDGYGQISTQSGILEQVYFSFTSRFGEVPGTNPEELIAAAHASCFTMKLSFVLNEAGFTAELLETRCHITFENAVITESHLIVKAKVSRISQETFDACIKETELYGPVSRMLNARIFIEASLVK
ncbi:OsmC family peroxiredoxin [Cytophagaceae bacterium DM2B3-1]|uniref:OsmC family peroxiredoxin n=1 Tax=Xanthocytophaga flava TaxID=3048013 RepID=A0ABT7CGQ1_9BACT|nr:OsmC family peroxiredoxin [Xanthocytophaga flavus]MDJ1471102.1 OsmC family peroxiredoxin [Xanthocytophaga flavus]MDJ1492911.1 OsmC family peroxiredoxin [Xanthocytophaga flavus]